MTLLLLLALVAQQPVHPVYVNLSVVIENGSSGGSGTIFQVCGPDALVLTCGHIFREGEGSIVVTRRDGSQQPGRLWAVAASVDLAAVVIATPPDAAMLWRGMGGGAGVSNWELTISRSNPRGIVALGWGTGDLALHRGPFLARLNATDVEYGITPRSGDSGGGAWSESGEFAGVVVWVSGDGTGGVIGSDTVRRFYETVHLGRRKVA